MQKLPQVPVLRKMPDRFYEIQKHVRTFFPKCSPAKKLKERFSIFFMS